MGKAKRQRTAFPGRTVDVLARCRRRLRRKRAWAAAGRQSLSFLLAVCLVLQPLIVEAQGIGGSSPLGNGLPASLDAAQVQQLLQSGQASQLLQQLPQQGGANQGDLAPNQSVQGSDQEIAPGGQVQLPPSAIEQSFSQRAGVPLKQFGYGAFGQGRPIVTGQAGAIADSYVLGPGDEIVVNLRGQQQDTYRVRVDREGRVVVPGLPPVTAAGRSFGEFRQDFEAVVGKSFVGTEAFLSLGEVRQLSILVLGEVRAPGMVHVSALSSVLDALLLAGGVKRTGSLRAIHLYRGDEDLPVDLYTVLTTQGTKITLSLQNGDRILVPPINDLVAAVGEVRRPGIFELAPGQRQIAGSDLLELAGGLPRGAYRYSLQEIQADGSEKLVPLSNPNARPVRGNEILFARPLRNVVGGKVQLLGNVRLPGEYPLSRYGSLQALVGRSEALASSPYLPYAVLETTDPRTLTRTFRSFDLGQVLSGRHNVPLHDSDRVFIFGTQDISFLSSQTVLNALRGVLPGERTGPGPDGTPDSTVPGGNVFDPSAGPQGFGPGSDMMDGNASGPWSTAGANWPNNGAQGYSSQRAAEGQSCAGAALLALRVRNGRNGELATGQLAEAARKMTGMKIDCPVLFDQVPELLSFMISQSVFVAGDARRPGIYPIANPARAQEVLSIAGASPEARLNTNLPRGEASTGGAQNILETREARVTLAGAVKFPGSRDLSAVRTLRDLIGDRSVYVDRPYLLFGVIARQDQKTLAREILPFSPIQVIEGDQNIPLRDQDLVLLFSQEDIYHLVGQIQKEQEEQLKAPPLKPALGGGQASELERAAQGPATGSSPSLASVSELTSPLEQITAAQQANSADQQAQDARSAKMLAQMAKLSPPTSPWSEQNEPGKEGVQDRTPSLPLDYDVLSPIVIDHLATISGAVNRPGDYPVMPQTQMGSLLSVAGGLRADADLSAVEVSTTVPVPAQARSVTERNLFDLRSGNFDRILVSPRDVVFLRELSGNRESGAVAMLGEVRHPGHYDILRNETLSSVVRRAGGLTEVAYPYGAIFTRVSAARAEREALNRVADQIARGLSTVALTPPPSKQNQLGPQDFAFLQKTLDDLRHGPVLGRISVEANPAMLAVHPELDTLMQPGDAVYYPKRPSTVLVSGEVLNQGSQQFISGQSAKAYLTAAGGTTQDADRGRSFLLLPDGTAKPLHMSAWDFRSDTIPPGSAIIVPRDLRPFSTWTFVTNLTQVLSQIAISAASLAVVSRR